ncbi:hypothetical protein Syncc9902_0110 [Synechococcus sp. CC9902]|nr:hypothetical protein Syncc9902_0110 [Synechococcus sp. CC9902]
MFAPEDQLETLWNSGYGEATSQLVRDLSTDFVFTSHQIEVRTSIGNFFNIHGLSHSLSPQLMIANFLLSPPGLLEINNVDSFFDTWLVSVYHKLYSSTSAASSTNDDSIGVMSPPSLDTLDFGPFPNSLHDLVNNRIHLNRLLGLANLYYIDPDDREIFSELSEIRSALSQLILNTNESDLQQLWASDFGERYWALVRSGIQAESLSESDQHLKSSVVEHLSPTNGGFGSPRSTNAFLVAMLFFLPGSMKVDDAQSKIPSWLYSNYSQIFASTQPG